MLCGRRGFCCRRYLLFLLLLLLVAAAARSREPVLNPVECRVDDMLDRFVEQIGLQIFFSIVSSYLDKLKELTRAGTKARPATVGPAPRTRWLFALAKMGAEYRTI